MAKYKVVKTSLNQNLNGEYFNDTPSNTIFSFGKFFVTTNFDDKVTINYTNSLSSFVRPITLEGLNVSKTQSEIIESYSTNAVLNLDKSDLNTFVRYGSAYEFVRTSIENIIVKYPGSLFANSQKEIGGVITYNELNYDETLNISTFLLPINCTVNIFGLILNDGNTTIPEDNELKNLNLSYNNYVIWSNLESDTLFNVIGYTGNTVNDSNPDNRNNLRLQVEGNPFKSMGTGQTGYVDYHIRPKNVFFEEFRALLNPYEQNIVSNRIDNTGFNFNLKDPTLLENGKIVYSDTNIVWATSDGYNIDVDTSNYETFLRIILTIGAKYDKIKTDLIARFLSTTSLKTYDLTEEGKVTKLLRLYGAEFDQIREFIDSLVNINKITYDKLNNVPDQIIKNMANTFGWDYFSLVNESELIDGFLTVDDTERNLNEDILPAEIDIELWRRIINNTSYFWKSKGTRQAIKSMFLLIGIPEPFINITEYVYTVDGKINPNTVPLEKNDFPSKSLPYDTEGYPIAPLETNDFYFQISGNTDAGQNYLDVFRSAGFNLKQTPDNKKSWIQTGATTRIHNTTPQYYQEDSRLVINTKEVDVALDTARGIEFDVYEYIKKDFAANSSGYTLPYSYVNISAIPQVGNVFTLPYNVNEIQGDFEVRYNGILLNAPTISGVTNLTRADYTISGNEFTIPELSGGTRPTDVIQATLISSGGTAVTGITVDYIVTRVDAKLNGTYVPLPTFPRGDVQLTINGIALTKGTSQFVADYIVDPANSSGNTNNQIIIQNPDVIAYLNENPEIQISYVDVGGSNDINLRSEIIRVDSFNSGKVYFNHSANKYVYKLNYKINDASEVKILINGIALEPNKDYNVNVQNPYEIFLPKGITYGTVISAYYLVGGSGAFNPVINDVFGLGDITELSFLEFLELVQRKMINVRNRKTISNFKGGWYPSILKLYETYLSRASLPNDNPLQSNGYSFQNLYSFLSKYNAFFQRFSATIITRRSGLLIRNSVFTKQKHWYKRGVNVANPNNIDYDMRGREILQYFGNDGSESEIFQWNIAPPPPQLYVDTTEGILGSIITGGENIVGYDILTSYGIQYRIKNSGSPWTKITEVGSLGVNNFSITIPDSALDFDTEYEYNAFIISDIYNYGGNVQIITTESAPLATPSLSTKKGSLTGNNILGTGGKNIVRYGDVEYYGMLYTIKGNTTWLYSPNPPSNGPLYIDNYILNIENLDYDEIYQYRARMVVDGTEYLGTIKEVMIPALPTYAPTVNTGLAVASIFNPFFLTITDNTLVTTGGKIITEYGTVYSKTANANATLRLNLTGVLSKINVGSISDNTNWTDIPDTFSPSTLYYYRAFATNVNGTSYGTIKSESTNGVVPPPAGYVVTLGSLVHSVPIDGAEYSSCATAKINVSNSLTSSDSFKINYTNTTGNETSTALSYVINAISYIKKVTQKCGCVCSHIEAQEANKTDGCTTSGYICVYGNKLNDYTICGVALSHDSHYNSTYKNCSVTCFTSISDIAGNKDITLCGCTPTLVVWNPNQTYGGTGAKICDNYLPELPM